MVLGRSAGLSEAQLAHLGDDPLPDDVYDPLERAVVTYARRATAMAPIDDDLYGALEDGLGRRGVMDLCFTVGLANLINRFHATFLTDVDPETGKAIGPSCPLPTPPVPPGRPERVP